jgi:hypothetical protein
MVFIISIVLFNVVNYLVYASIIYVDAVTKRITTKPISAKHIMTKLYRWESILAVSQLPQIQNNYCEIWCTAFMCKNMKFLAFCWAGLMTHRECSLTVCFLGVG